MGVILGKIVLTGGPCAGKTTALARIEENLTELGYKVFIVGESATEIIKGGIKPFGNKPIDLVKFQELIITYQLSKEKIYDEAALSLPEEEKCVIVYDRGVMDNKAYVKDNEFKEILKKLNLDELELIDSYDMVVHLVTAADGKEEYYTLENNAARTETIEEAKALDKKTANAWIGHNNLVIIDNQYDFKDKMTAVLDNINNLLKNPISIRKQRKFIVDLDKSNLSFINNNEMIKIDIEQTYLIDKDLSDSYEKRLRKKSYNGCNTYYITLQKKGENGLSKIITDKKISEKEYNKLMSMYDEKYTINKTRYSFIKNKQYFKLDIFENNISILEINPTKENKKISIPKNLSVVKEITNDVEYQNFKMAVHNDNKRYILN
ncbi:MAG TPA: AAA family ATPase [Tenericutes bacterium]|nr:AAA family ATPase [Mycoplasmatota bacterium]